ncbi:MAG: pentapeptide repeat-containing protein [Cyanobacteria bacterium J06638_20]
MASRLWKFLTTDIRELASLDAVDSTADAADAVLGLAEALAEEGPQIAQLAPLVNQLDSLLDALNSPFGKLVGASLPFISIATGLLRFYLETTQSEPTLAQSVALLSQAAYLESFKEFITRQSPQNQQALMAASQKKPSPTLNSAMKALAALELTDKDARFATLYFHQSALATAFNQALQARLEHIGIDPAKALKIAELVARNTDKHMRIAIAEAGDQVQRITEWYRVGGDAVFEKYLSIDTYLEEWIAPRPHENVFAEPFTFKDIYVPLKAHPLTKSGDYDGWKNPVVLDEWIKLKLHSDNQKDKVLFIQGGPGRGKSVFCRMFADWVRRHEHPRWTPILIRLRDVSVLSRDFEETLAKAVDRDFAKTDSGWLTDRNVNFLFILDGFDELLMEGRTSGGLDHFLDQVGRFQEQCARNSEKGHQVLITGRTLALQVIESRMPDNLARVEILPMDNEIQQQWFERWSQLIGQDKPHFMDISHDKRLPERLRELAREPLLLYLLAAMYRDDELRLDMFAGAKGAKAKVLIYERTLDWVLTKQRAERHHRKEETSAVTQDTEAHDLNPNITELAPENLRRILQEAGLCVVQSGMEFVRIKTIEMRLQQDSAAKQFLAEAQRRLKTDDTPQKTDDTPLRNALAAFYLQEGRQGEGSIEFVHKSFGEFLCAERIVNGLIDICQPSRNREYDIDDPAFCWLMYDLLGCHVLTPEIVEYLTALLTKHPEFEPQKLHQRLYDFYWRWSEGEFIDAPPENLPQQKMRLLRERTPDREERLGQRQVDVYTGLNLMILLFELHRYGLPSLGSTSAQTPEATERPQSTLEFNPCQHPTNSDVVDEERLRRLIGISHCLGVSAFQQLLSSFLHYTNLRDADLSSADLRDADLRDADLCYADLRDADLSSAVLRDADLRDAVLRSADLRSADLRSADLCSADLCSTDLSDTDLRSTDLSSADLSSAVLRAADLRAADLRSAVLRSAVLSDADLRNADLSDTDLTRTKLSDEYGTIQWNEDTNWNGVKGLASAIGVPEALKRQLGL